MQTVSTNHSFSLTLVALIANLLFNAASSFAESDPSAHSAEVYGRSNAIPYYNRANRYLNQGRYEEAALDLEQAINYYPNDPDFHTNLGIAYRKLDRYLDAEREFKTAIAFNKDDWMNWSNLANAYLKQNLLEKTVATFEEALKHHPPAKDAAAMKQDITDIKKILAMRQPPQHNKVEQNKTPAAPSLATSIKPSTVKHVSKANPGARQADKIPLAETLQSSTSSGTTATNKLLPNSASDWGYSSSPTDGPAGR